MGAVYHEIARVLADDVLDDDGVAKHAAAARKRFERTKEKLRVLAKDAGLI